MIGTALRWKAVNDLGWRAAMPQVSGLGVVAVAGNLADWRPLRGGWRNGPQTPRPQAPPGGIRHKAPPDIEGIETAAGGALPI
jgi:hypothetical protein